jgi:hypothetical protein
VRISNILVRSPKTQKGADENKDQFTSNKPPDVQDVEGYGDSAYWNPSFGQLNVLKGDTWYILSNNIGAFSQSPRLDDAKKLADELKDNF